jgi:hypothetical protein
LAGTSPKVFAVVHQTVRDVPADPLQPSTAHAHLLPVLPRQAPRQG